MCTTWLYHVPYFGNIIRAYLVDVADSEEILAIPSSGRKRHSIEDVLQSNQNSQSIVYIVGENNDIAYDLHSHAFAISSFTLSPFIAPQLVFCV